MSECDFIRRIDAYCDGELSPAEEARVDAHIVTCPACAARVREIRFLGDLIASAGNVPGLSYTARGRLRLSAANGWERENVRWAWGISGIAAAVLIGASVWVATTPAATSTGGGAGSWERVAAAGGKTTTVAEDAFADAQDARTASWIVSDLGLNQER